MPKAAPKLLDPVFAFVFATVVGDCSVASKSSELANAAMSTYDFGSKCETEMDVLDLPETLLPTDSLDGIFRNFGGGFVERGREDIPGVAPALRLRLRWCPAERRDELERGLRTSNAASGACGLSRGLPKGGVG